MRSSHTLALIALGTLCAGTTAAAAGARTPLGATIRDAELPAAAGGKLSITGGASANVVVFFRPDQRQTQATLKALAICEKELAQKSVRWLAVVPGRFSPEDAKAAVQAAGLQMPVAIDAGDVVYNELGVSVLPTVAVLDGQRRLQQFQPFTKLNFCEQVMARIRRVLGEVDDAQLTRLLNPSADEPTGLVSEARRDLKLAQLLLDGGNADKALELARKGARKDPASAAAQALIGRILAKKGDCAAAAAAFEAALRLDASEPQAQAGKQACAGKR